MTITYITIPNLNTSTALTDPDYVVVHDTETNRTNKVRADIIASYVVNKARTDHSFTASDINSTNGNTVQQQLDKSVSFVNTVNDFTTHVAPIGSVVYCKSFDGSVPHKGGGAFGVKAAGDFSFIYADYYTNTTAGLIFYRLDYSKTYDSSKVALLMGGRLVANTGDGNVSFIQQWITENNPDQNINLIDASKSTYTSSNELTSIISEVNDVVQRCTPDYVIIAADFTFSGIRASSSANEKSTKARQYINSLFKLRDKLSAIGCTLIVVGVLPNNNLSPLEYKYLRLTNDNLARSDLNYIELLNVLDDGNGLFKTGTFAGAGRPNQVGNDLLFAAMPAYPLYNFKKDDSSSVIKTTPSYYWTVLSSGSSLGGAVAAFDGFGTATERAYRSLTVSFYVKRGNTSSAGKILCVIPGSTETNPARYLRITNSTNNWEVAYGNSTIITSSKASTDKTWDHLCLVYSRQLPGSSSPDFVKFYVNGQSAGTANISIGNFHDGIYFGSNDPLDNAEIAGGYSFYDIAVWRYDLSDDQVFDASKHIFTKGGIAFLGEIEAKKNDDGLIGFLVDRSGNGYSTLTYNTANIAVNQLPLVTDLSTTVSNIENNTGTLFGQVGSLQNTVNGHTSQFVTVNQNIYTVQSNINNSIQPQIDTLHSDMVTAKSDITTLKSDMATTKSDVGGHSTAITLLQSKSSQHEYRLGTLEVLTSGTATTISGLTGKFDRGKFYPTFDGFSSSDFSVRDCSYMRVDKLLHFELRFEWPENSYSTSQIRILMPWLAWGYPVFKDVVYTGSGILSGTTPYAYIDKDASGTASGYYLVVKSRVEGDSTSYDSDISPALAGKLKITGSYIIV